MRLAGLNVGTYGSVVKGFGWCGKVLRGLKDRMVESVLAIGGDERDEEGLGVGELVMREEGRKEGEKGREGVGGSGGEGGEMKLRPFEEGEESGGVRV